jgi:hypothetical protein
VVLHPKVEGSGRVMQRRRHLSPSCFPRRFSGTALRGTNNTPNKQLHHDVMAGIFEQSRNGGTLCKLDELCVSRYI